MNFTGRTAIVTGAGRGLGFSYARRLATLGANVVISDVGADKLGAGGDGSIVMHVVQTLNALSMEGAPVGILVNTVSPVAKTRMCGPVDLARVKAASAEQVAQRWNEIKEC